MTSWQRLKKATNPDGTVKNITWEWQAAGSDRLYNSKEEFTGKPTTRVHYDALNRKVRNSVVGFDGAEVLTDHVYDAQGRPIKTSLPYKTGSPLWNVTAYDVYDRATNVTEAAGATTTVSYSGASVTTSKNSVSTTKTTDATGALTSVVNPAGAITYTYKPDGQAASIAAPGGATTTFSYDVFGRQTQIADPSAGTVSYTYDAAGNRNKITDANAKSVSSTFDAYNRIVTKTAVELTSTYAYNTDGWLASITNNNSTAKSFTYDALGRVTKTIETVGSETYQVDYTYTNGKITKTVHAPMTYTINYLYNTYGYLNKLTDVNNTAIKTINKMTVFGQVEETLMGNGLLQTNTFNTYGFLTGIKSMNGSTAVQNFTYSVDNLKGNITSRKDETRSLTENFTYDNLDRLLNYGLSTATKTIAYNNATGNITSKSDVGTYKYNTSGKPYAMSSATVTSGNTVPTQMQQVSYTSFARPKNLSEGTYTIDFTYDEDYERVKQEFKTSGSLTYTRYYFNGGQYEKTVQGSTAKTIFYLDGTPYTATVALENNNGTTRLLYINRDNIGSITHITNASKALQAEYSFDAWGRMRNPATLALYAIGADPALLLNRGYTGHEHVKEFGLINMNARLYDAVVGRMLSADMLVPDPLNSTHYNRYNYANNNPLIYNDPDGNFALLLTYLLFHTETGYDIQKFLSPVAVKMTASFGTHQRGLGIDASVGIPQFAGAGGRYHVGASYYWKNYDMPSGWETRYGYEVALSPFTSFSSTYYNSPGDKFDQKTGMVKHGLPGMNVKYENDWFWGLKIGDDGDRYRTTGVKINAGGISVGLNLFTGDPGGRSYKDRETQMINGIETYVYNDRFGTDPDEYRAGVLYIEIGPFRFGNDKESRRNQIQNRWVHSNTSDPYFNYQRWRKNKWYFQFGANSIW